MWDRLRRYLRIPEDTTHDGVLPPTWGYYAPQQHEPWDNILAAIEERCTGKPVLVVFDSINTIASP